MYDPKFRFAFLVSLMVIFGAGIQVIYTYVLGETGLNLQHYFRGVVQVGGATFGGVFFVWLCTQFITLAQYAKTGFEATHVDETGTGFNFPVSLSKFLPDLIATPAAESLSPLEAELMGFLNGYRTWPADLNNLQDTLYKRSLQRWAAMRRLEGASPLHRAAALAVDLGKIYAFEEKRSSFPMWQFWRRDKIKFVQRCKDHGGLSAFVLSQMPSFRALGLSQGKDVNRQIRRALLTAVRYHNDPLHMPANSDPITRNLHEMLLKAEQQRLKWLQQHNNETQTDASPEERARLQQELTNFFVATVRELNLNPVDLNDKAPGFYLGNGQVVLRLPALINAASNKISNDLRLIFNLIDITENKHPVWDMVVDICDEQGLGILTKQWDDIYTDSGLFNFRIGEIMLNNCLLLQFTRTQYPNLRQHLDSYPPFDGVVELQHDDATLLAEMRSKVAAVDDMLLELEK